MVSVRGKRTKESSGVYIDYNLIFIVLFLLAFGLVMLYSVSSYEANLDFGDSAYYFKHQLFPTLLGIGIMLLVAHIPYHFWNKVSVLAYLGSIFLLLMIIPFGKTVNGAKRWIYLFGVISIQPAEVAKLGMIVFLASVIVKMGPRLRIERNFWMVLGLCVPVVLAVYGITSNLSSALIIISIALIMLFIATPGYSRFLLLGLAVLALAVLVVALAINADSLGLGGYRFGRIQVWLDPDADVSGKGYQTLQALYAIGSGGMFGKGLGQSMQKLGFVPEAQNDMIFSIICEELGLFGAMAVIMLFILLIWRMMVIANNAPDLYGALLVVGVMSHIAVQVILNICVVTNTIPNTGITLPFISYGGTAILLLLTEIGIVLSVARSIGK
ncbi:MAG: putative lipid II flippase FtsW [Butyrivibrio sp.]|nr:putative lipid II flippase FtsW [Butyrivibrio sp.]